MNSPKISIIVPVYNVEVHICNCIDSILEQTFTDYELILIDDGSLDSSGKICDEYTQKDTRIKVIHQMNKGSGIARNVGISESKGDYIAFIDSDDYVDNDYLSSMYEIAMKEKVDMVIASYYTEINKKTKKNKNKPSSLINKQIALDFINGKLHAGLWNKLIKRDFIIRNKILFPNDSYYEDMYFTISSLMNGCQVTYLDKATYHYAINQNSLTFNIDIKKRKKAFKEFAHNIQNLTIHFNLNDDKDFAYSINRLINSNKIKFISKFYNYKDDVYEILNYIPSNFNIKDIKKPLDVAYYVAVRFNTYFLFNIYSKIKNIKNIFDKLH